jgi:hypothetical protein
MKVYLFQQVLRAKRFYKGNFIDHHEGSFRPIKKYRLIPGDLPGDDTTDEDKVRKAISSVEHNLNRRPRAVQQLLLTSSEEDGDDDTSAVPSVVGPTNQVQQTPARAQEAVSSARDEGKTPKIENRKVKPSTKKKTKKRYHAADDDDDAEDEMMVAAHKNALIGKNQETTRHNEQLEQLEEKKFLKSIEYADRQFKHTVKMEERAATQQEGLSSEQATSVKIANDDKAFDLRQKLYAAYTELKEKGLSDKQIKKIHPQLEVFFDDDDTSVATTTRNTNKKKKK